MNPSIEASENEVFAICYEGEYSVDVTSNVSWNCFYDADWIYLPYATGIGNDELTIVLTENDTGENRSATITIVGGGISETIVVTQSPDAEPLNTPYLMELIIESEYLEFYGINIEPDSQSGYGNITMRYEWNIVIKPEVFETDESNGLVDISGEITEIKYFLNGFEYDTLTVGVLGEFDFYDLWGVSEIAIGIELIGGATLTYTFNIEVTLMPPR